MRIICDACAKAPAILFCAADEAALCGPCDAMVHMCNKLARRHVRVRLVEPNAVACCDICENLPAFFFCKVDGTSLCLQCDVIVHVGVKRSHERYLLLRQRVEHAEPIAEREQNELLYQRQILGKFNEKVDDFPPVDMTQVHDSAVIDLNAGPQGMQGRISNSS